MEKSKQKFYLMGIRENNIITPAIMASNNSDLNFYIITDNLSNEKLNKDVKMLIEKDENLAFLEYGTNLLKDILKNSQIKTIAIYINNVKKLITKNYFINQIIEGAIN